MTQLGLSGFPTTFFDGGYRSLSGGTSSTSYYTTRMNACGARTVPDLDLLVSTEWLDQYDEVKIHVAIGNGVLANEVPLQPTVSCTDTLGQQNVIYWFAGTADASEDNDVWLQYDWGDGDTTDWLGPIGAGSHMNRPHAYSGYGQYEIRVRAKDGWDEVSDWSDPFTMSIDCCSGTVGNIDLQGGIDGADLSYLLDFLFIDFTPLPCLRAADMDLSGAPDPQPEDVNGIDLSYMLDHLFISLDPLPACP